MDQIFVSFVRYEKLFGIIDFTNSGAGYINREIDVVDTQGGKDRVMYHLPVSEVMHHGTQVPMV
jgi:hypothetical protein